jgi:hypothetical protein
MAERERLENARRCRQAVSACDADVQAIPFCVLNDTRGLRLRPADLR